MFRQSVIKAWVAAVLVYFAVSALSHVVDGVAELALTIGVCAFYGLVLGYSLIPPREISPERPSAVRARIEAAQRRREQS